MMDQHDELRLLRGACAASQTGAWSYRIGEDRVEWTPFLYALFGVPDTRAITLEIGLSFYTDQSRQQIRDAVNACLAHGTPWSLDVQCRATSGRVFWARAIGEAIRHEGAIVALHGAFQDITRERAALQEGARAQEELSFVMRTMTDGFFLLDTEWRFVFVNAASERMLRRDPLDLVGKGIWEEFPEAIGTIFERSYQQVRDTGVSTSFRSYFAPLETWFQVTVHPAQTGIAVQFRDITREMDEQRDLRLFRTAIDAMTKGAIMLEQREAAEEDWTIIYANPAAVALQQGDALPLPGRPLTEVARDVTCTPDLGQVLACLSADRLCRFEARHRRPDGQRILECVAVPLTDEGDRSGHAVILIDDVTEQRRIVEERQRSERLALIGQMAGGVSHDFNNLLAVILGNIELLELTRDTDEAAVLIAEARDAVMRGRSLNDSLLAFAGKARLAPQTADLGGFVQSWTPFMRRAIPSRIRLEVEVDDDLAPVLIDAAMAESCVLNLALNARDAITGPGTIHIALRMAHRPRPGGGAGRDWVCLSVADTGCGVPEELHDRVFQPFFTTRGPGQGSGLGLSRVRGYLEQIGGFVTLSSLVGQGTTVSMFFPVAPIDTRDGVERAQPSGPVVRRPLRALVVDDTPAVARVIARMLASLGCETLIAANGAEARAIIARDGALDLMISDVVMPGESGLDLARSVSRTHPGIRVALMSGYTRDNHPGDAALAKTRFLEKPVSRAQLEAFLFAPEADA